MKKNMHLLLALSTMFTGNLMAQNDTLPNGGFERWTDHGGMYEEPTGWYSLNFLYQAGFDPANIKTTDKRSGTYALLLETISGPGNTDIPGLLCSNFMFEANGTPNFDKNLIPFHSRPVSLDFYFKSAPATGDSSAGFMLLSKWNSSSGKRDTIGIANWTQSATVNSYTKAVVPFIYLSSAIPDSASLIFTSSFNGFNPTPGSQLYLDDLSLNYTSTGTGEEKNREQISFYPNPVSSTLNIEGLRHPCRIIVTDLNGKTLLSIAANTQIQAIDLSSLPPSFYFIRLLTTEGSFISAHKLVKQ